MARITKARKLETTYWVDEKRFHGERVAVAAARTDPQLEEERSGTEDANILFLRT